MLELNSLLFRQFTVYRLNNLLFEWFTVKYLNTLKFKQLSKIDMFNKAISINCMILIKIEDIMKLRVVKYVVLVSPLN